jgi:hypothetical protein
MKFRHANFGAALTGRLLHPRYEELDNYSSAPERAHKEFTSAWHLLNDRRQPSAGRLHAKLAWDLRTWQLAMK